MAGASDERMNMAAVAMFSPESDYRLLFECAPGLLLILDRTFTIVTANDAYCRATMTEREGIVGRNVFDAFPDNPDDPAADGVANLRNSLERVLQFRRPDTMAIQKYDVRRPESEGGGFEERYWSPVNSPALDANGEVRWIIHCVEDVTELVRVRASDTARAEFAREQQQAVERLREANRELAEQMAQVERLRKRSLFFELLVEFSTDAIITESPDGHVMTWNKAAERMLGYAAEEMIGKSLSILQPPDRRQELEAVDKRLWAGERISNFETAWRRKDGTDIVVVVSVSCIRGEQHEIVAASKIARDITEQKSADERLKSLQDELVHLSRWNTMGMMASTIAHELNQPLTAIMNYVTAARRTMQAVDAPQIARASEFLEKAANETKLAGGITRTLREFIEQRKTKRSVEDINKIVEDTASLGLAGGAEVRAILRLNLKTGLEPVRVDRIQIQQVLLNLIRNAVDAMQGMDQRRLLVSTHPDEPGFIGVCVSDSGPGIPPEIMARLFQPFVTTKANGMGIGLTICQSIIEAHGGKIWSSANEDRGVSFRFRLPVTEAAEAQNAA